MEKNLKRLGAFGIISLLSYTAMVVFSPLAYSGYEMFPWVSGAAATEPQNVLHFIVTVLIVVLSLADLILIIIGAKGKDLTALRIWAIICLAAMLIGSVGTVLLPKAPVINTMVEILNGNE